MPTISTFSPKSGALAEQELINSQSWLIALRWLGGIGVLLATWVLANMLGLSIPAVALYFLGLGLLIYNIIFWWAWKWLKTNLPSFDLKDDAVSVIYQWFTRLQIGVDWVAMTLLIHYTGGIESPTIFYFLFHITIASLLLPHKHGFLYVTLAPVLVGAVAFLEYQGILPHIYIFEPARHNNIFYIMGILFFFATASYVMAYFSIAISQRLRRREDELTGLYRSVQATTSTLDLTEVLNRLAEATANTIGCKGAAIRLLDETGRYLEMTTSYGLSESYREKDPIEVTRAQIDQEALSGKTVLVPDTSRENRLCYPEKVAAEGIRSMLITPLIGKKGPFGVIRAYCDKLYRFTEDDAAFLQAIASQGVVAIENAQAYQLLEDLDRSKSQFVRIVTHELRSPVQVTTSLLSVLNKGYVGELNEKQADLLQRAQRRLEFLQTLISDLLDLAAGKSDVLTLAERRIISLNDVIREVSARFDVPIQDKGLTLRIMTPDQILSVRGDFAELDRIIGNLVSNAVKYTSQGEVCILLEQADEAARIIVSDTGIGIPQKALPHLFEEFFRAENAKVMREAGTGLGLSIVKDLIERYGGQLNVESVEGEGTTFTIFLPLAPVSR